MRVCGGRQAVRERGRTDNIFGGTGEGKRSKKP